MVVGRIQEIVKSTMRRIVFSRFNFNRQYGQMFYAGNWPGTACTSLGFNEHGGKIWKWNYNGSSLSEGTTIIFNNNGSNQTANCTFKNGAWYSSSNTGNNTSPISTAVEPSEEISVANMGTTSPTATNWNGKSEKVAQETSNGTTDKTMSKATTGVGMDNTYIDVRGVSDFSFFERGENRNALIKAAAGTLPAQLPYNVIVNGICAYLTTPTPPPTDNNARISVSFGGDGGETGIQVVTPDVEPMKQQSIYNLSGQRVYTPSKKGIYIVGDRKYIVK